MNASGTRGTAEGNDDGAHGCSMTTEQSRIGLQQTLLEPRHLSAEFEAAASGDTPVVSSRARIANGVQPQLRVLGIDLNLLRIQRHLHTIRRQSDEQQCAEIPSPSPLLSMAADHDQKECVDRTDAYTASPVCASGRTRAEILAMPALPPPRCVASGISAAIRAIAHHRSYGHVPTELARAPQPPKPLTWDSSSEDLLDEVDAYLFAHRTGLPPGYLHARRRFGQAPQKRLCDSDDSIEGDSWTGFEMQSS